MKIPKDPEAAETVQSKETPAVAPVATCSPRRCDAAHRKINEATQIRPVGENQERDGRWHYVHRTDAHSAADEAWKEGVASFAAWLVDNAEGETITEELLMQWGTRCIRESDPLRDILENAGALRHGAENGNESNL